MKNVRKNLKRIFILLFILLFANNTIAAVVSDNDGSAFITKAEFDSLKTNFQLELNTYNTQIDSKIDDAISKYLTGVTVTVEPFNYWEKIEETTGGNLYWQCSVNAGTENLTSQVNLSVTRELTEKYARPQAYGWWNSTSESYRWDATNQKVVTSGGTEVTGVTKGKYWIRHFVNATTGGGTDIRYYDLIDFKGSFGNRYTGAGSTRYKDHTWQVADTDWTGSATPTLPSELQTYYSSNNNATDGSGTRWEVHKNLIGKKVLRNYYTSYYPIICFTVWDHIYYDNVTINSAFSSDGRSWNTAGTAVAPLLSEWGTKTNGNAKITKDDPNYETSSNYVEVRGMINKISDGVDYSSRMFSGSAMSSLIYYSFDDAAPYRVGTDYNTIETPEGSFYDLYHATKAELLQNNKIAKYTLSYQKYNVSWIQDYLSDFYNEFVSQSVGEDVYVGQGVKLAASQDSKKRDYTIKLKFKRATSYGNQVAYVLTNKKFNKDGSVPSDATVFEDSTTTIGTEITKDITLDSKEGLWINIQSPTDDLVTIDEFSIRVK